MSAPATLAIAALLLLQSCASRPAQRDFHPLDMSPPKLAEETACVSPAPKQVCAKGQGTPDGSSAPSLWGEAREASEIGEHCGALRLAERVLRMRPMAVVRLFIAQQQKALGWDSEAARSAELCLVEAGAEESSHQDKIVAACRALVSDRTAWLILAPAHWVARVRRWSMARWRSE